MQRYKIQVAHTFEFVTVSTHDDWDDAQDSAIEQIQLHGEDRVRIVHLDNVDTKGKSAIILEASRRGITLAPEDVTGAPGEFLIDGMPWDQWLDIMTMD